ncbi:hypothetical protein CHS0354_000475 [Potamilus streckersoni]|uniref:Molecular chaperone DnaK n=1 Tax=Potamilus streckersoni TaxID=2493646 RepID=A0AAE0W7C4_9BIVA|nr:hypothetical protein CHS0354_000475 [Potamilus streckersoni]
MDSSKRSNPILATKKSTIKRERIIGIDLGTTNSLVSYMHDDHPAIIANKTTGKRSLSSVVYFDDSFKPHVGLNLDQATVPISSNRFIYSIKRLMGRAFADAKNEQHYLSYAISESESERICKVEISNGNETRFFTPIEISSMILSELKQWAEAYFEEPVEKAVITVPAYFNDSQRTATKMAGKLAGLNVIRIINEPTAASLAYGLDRTKDGTIVIYDFGGGTFDVSILKLDNGIFEVLATNGNTHLGGDDINNALLTMILSNIKQTYNIDLNTKIPSHRNILAELKTAIEQAKKDLSQQETTQIIFTLSTETEKKKIMFDLDRTTLNQIALPFIEQTKAACLQALSDAEIKTTDITAVALVGGVTRMPLVKKYVTEIFDGLIPHDELNPDEAVALGAGIQAGVLSGQTDDVLLLDVTPLTLSIETVGGVVAPLIRRNSKIPIKAMQEFTTSMDNQTGVTIHVVQGEREFVTDNRSLAKFTLKPIPPMPAGLPRILVTFMLDQNGTLSVFAKDKHTGIEQHVEVNPTYGLKDEEVEAMLLAGFENAETDVENRLFAEAKSEAQSVHLAISKSLTLNQNIFLTLSTDEQTRILEAQKN